jgi:hypothetical protein
MGLHHRFLTAARRGAGLLSCASTWRPRTSAPPGPEGTSATSIRLGEVNPGNFVLARWPVPVLTTVRALLIEIAVVALAMVWVTGILAGITPLCAATVEQVELEDLLTGDHRSGTALTSVDSRGVNFRPRVRPVGGASQTRSG